MSSSLFERVIAFSYSSWCYTKLWSFCCRFVWWKFPTEKISVILTIANVVFLWCSVHLPCFLLYATGGNGTHCFISLWKIVFNFDASCTLLWNIQKCIALDRCAVKHGVRKVLSAVRSCCSQAVSDVRPSSPSNRPSLHCGKGPGMRIGTCAEGISKLHRRAVATGGSALQILLCPEKFILNI